MKKISLIITTMIFVTLSGCTSRSNGECDMSALVSCSFLYNDDAEIQACANKASDNACAVSALNPTSADSSVGTSYTCKDQSWSLAAIDAGYSVSYSSMKSTPVIFVDPSLDGNDVLNLLKNPQTSNVTYSIQNAVDLSKKDGLIVVCPGHYKEAVTINSAVHDNLQIVNIAGGGTKLSPYTVISTGGLGAPLTIEDTVGVKIDGLTFTDGFSSYGGGINVSSLRTETTNKPTVTILNSSIQNNSALSGGGIYIENKAIVDLNNTHIDGNSATSGGGIYISASSAQKNITCDSCTINENEAALAGPAAFIEGGDTLELSDSTIQGNRSGTSGLSLPAIYLAEGGMFSASNTDWGNSNNENQDGDIFDYLENYKYQTTGTTQIIGYRILSVLAAVSTISAHPIVIKRLSDQLATEGVKTGGGTFTETDAIDTQILVEKLETELQTRNLNNTNTDTSIASLKDSLTTYLDNHGVYDYIDAIETNTCNTGVEVGHACAP